MTNSTKKISLLKKRGVKKAAVFGSVARGEQTSKSDIDLLVEFQATPTLLEMARLQRELEHITKKPVDLVTYRSLHPLIRRRILRDQKVLYEK
jgi:predicted nucleotidyltransferase